MSPGLDRLRRASDVLEVEALPSLGGRLHRLRAFGHDLLRTPPALDAYRHEPMFWGAFVMAPWCNRLEAGPMVVASRTVDLAPSFPDGTAIHGQVRDRRWRVTYDELRVEAGGDGWPWRYEVRLGIDVEGPRLRLSHALTNRSNGPMPGGIGIHPWFAGPLEVSIAADEVYPSNEGAAVDLQPVGRPHDLRAIGPMPEGLDATWVTSASEPVRLRWPELGIRAAMRVSPEGRYLCAASPAGLGAVAVEPQTHAPQGLRRLLDQRSGGLRLLEAGETLRLAVELEFAYSR